MRDYDRKILSLNFGTKPRPTPQSVDEGGGIPPTSGIHWDSLFWMFIFASLATGVYLSFRTF